MNEEQRIIAAGSALAGQLDSMASSPPGDPGLSVHLHPMTAPCRGMNSTVPPMGLGEGEWVDLQDLRFDTGVATLRNGASLVYPGIATTLASLVSGGTFLGGMYVPANGCILVAVGIAGATRIIGYDSFNNTWSELTESSAASLTGVTRFSTATEQVSFSVALAPAISTGAEPVNVWIAQTGLAGEYPLVGRLPIEGATYRAWRHAPIPPPASSKCYAEAGMWFQGWKVTSAAMAGPGTASSGNLTWSQPTDLPLGGKYVLLTVNSAVSGNSVYVNGLADFLTSDVTSVIAAGVDGVQLQIAYECTVLNIWDNIRIGLTKKGTPATRALIWDPTTLTTTVRYNPYVTADMDGTRKYAGFDIDPSLLVDTTYDGIYFEWVGAVASPAAVSLKLYNIGINAGIAGGASFGATYYHSNSKAESPGVVCRSLGGAMLSAIGGTSCNGLRIPSSPLFVYQYNVFTEQLNSTVFNSSTGTRGTNTTLLYIKPSGATDYILYSTTVPQATCVTSGTNWVLPTGLSNPEQAAPPVNSWRCTWVYLNAYYKGRTLPPAIHQTMPIGKAVGSLNGRSIVISQSSASGASFYYANTDLWVSQANEPFRYLEYPRYDNNGIVADSAIKVNLGSGHRPQAIAQVVDSQFNRNAVLVFTDKGVYSVNGTSAQEIQAAGLVSQFGTLSPWSVATYGGIVVYLDSELHVRTLGGGEFQTLDYRKIETPISRIPVETHNESTGALITPNRVKWATGAIFGGKYYLAYTPSGGTLNTKILVYDFRLQGWVTDNPGLNGVGVGMLTVGEAWAPGKAGTIVPRASGMTKLFMFGSDGRLWQYETPSTFKDVWGTGVNDFTNISITAESREFMRGDLGEVFLGRVAVVADQGSGNLTVTRIGRVSGASATLGEIEVDGSTTWRYDRSATALASGEYVPLGISDVGVRYKITGTPAVAGWSVYCIGAELDQRDQGPGVA